MNSDADFDLFPVLSMTLEGGCVLEVKSRFYLYSIVDHVYCLGINADPSTVIGSNLLRGHDAIFDLEEKRFGVVAADISFLRWKRGSFT